MLMKRTLISIITFVLLVSFVKAQNLEIGSDCLNDDECLSEICQGGECRSQDILVLIQNARELQEQRESQSSAQGQGVCIENWQCASWTACVSGSQTRACRDLNNCDNTIKQTQKPPETQSCYISPTPSCTDGIKNQQEESVDCGGPCSSCKTCYDSQQNCHDGSCEEGIDCGGICTPCIVQEVGSSKVFWISFTSILLIAIIIIVGLLYWRLKKEAKVIGKDEVKWEHKKPPIQPSSLLRI